MNMSTTTTDDRHAAVQELFLLKKRKKSKIYSEALATYSINVGKALQAAKNITPTSPIYSLRRISIPTASGEPSPESTPETSPDNDLTMTSMFGGLVTPKPTFAETKVEVKMPEEVHYQLQEVPEDAIRDRLEEHVTRQKKGLQRFYKPEGLSAFVERGSRMARHLKDMNCKPETALELTLLCLYDLVLLVDDSVSMRFEQNRNRVDTLVKTLDAVAEVYALASEAGGISSVKFLNRGSGFTKVKPRQARKLVDKIQFQGLTKIGTELKKKVLDVYATAEMKRPLLVIVITDGEIEGERPGLLKKVIMGKAADLQKQHGGYPTGPQAVAYQFAAVGDDTGAKRLLKSLDDDAQLGDFIDCLPDEDLDCIDDEDLKWTILPKLLLGAISDYWDTMDTEELDETDRSHEIRHRALLGEDDEELSDEEL